MDRNLRTEGKWTLMSHNSIQEVACEMKAQWRWFQKQKQNLPQAEQA